MTSTIKVNNIQNQCGTAYIERCGTTITLGTSGDNITLACGATQTGFGRTGTVDWDTTAKTAGFTAVSGTGYFVNTTGGAITVTLPSSPSGGDIVAISDYAGTSTTNNITVARNGSNINGAASDLTISAENSAVTLIYVDGTEGWKTTYTSNTNNIVTPPAYVAATGGTVTCCGDYKIHTFTSPGTFTVTCAGNPLGSTSVDYLVVAGGGGGSGPGCATHGGGGGGAGGFREGYNPGSYTASPLATTALPVTVTGYPITVGGGGSTGTSGTRGSNSVFSTITSTGGGGGVGYGIYSVPADMPGGSGAGGGVDAPAIMIGAGNTPPVSPPQGNSPQTPLAGGWQGGAGGSGATGQGVKGSSIGGPGGSYGGPGGAGATTSISGSSTTYAGGGAGSSRADVPNNATGGPGGGGPANGGQSGTANTGGGGGGNHAPGSGGSGGSGIVIIRYKFQ